MLKPVIYLAPFQGITTHTYRKVYSRHFTDVTKYFTPFFAHIDHETRLSSRKEHELQHLPGYEVVPQILSKEADEIVRFAGICHERGFNEINWNLGCPFPQVADKRRGSGMLPFPDVLKQILDDVMGTVKIRFSIKCRLGYFKPEEIFDLIPVFNAFPVHEIIIHGRIGRQLYSGTVDLNTTLSFFNNSKIPVVYNGDIFNREDAQFIMDKFKGLEKMMIGRGILNNPFLPGEITGREINGDRRELLKRFMDDLYFEYRKDMNDRLTILNLLKEYWDYLSNSFADPHKVKKIIKKSKTFDDYEDAARQIFLETPYR